MVYFGIADEIYNSFFLFSTGGRATETDNKAEPCYQNA